MVPIYVDCTTKGAHQDLMAQYGVRGFPTMLYVDPTGKKLGEMRDRSAAALARDFDALAKQYPGKGSMWAGSLPTAIEGAKKKKKLVAVYLTGESDDLGKLAKSLGDRRTKFFWVLEAGSEEAMKEWGVEGFPAVVLLDPALEEPKKAPVAKIVRFEKPEALNKSLDEALRPKPKPVDPPAPE